MKCKNVTFSILEKIEKVKLKKETIKIKNLYEKRIQDIQQLELLNNYKKEYIKKIHTKIILGVPVTKWKNYNDFISILQIIIRDNKNIIEKNQKIIEENLKNWRKNQNKVKVWQHLNIKNKNKILRIKKIQEQILNDHYFQLKFLKKG